jgi:Nif-specific regulatory protein
LANGGTIFLDEIGELPLALQTKLLRTLQEGTILRLGGKREKKVDVRLVAATHRDLEQEAARGQFRRDLFYRLYVIPIRLPSLRERPEDIPLLALHFLNRANQAHQRNVNFTHAALGRLARHPWPGNIRELANIIERMVLLTDDLLVDEDAVQRLLADGNLATEGAAAAPADALAAATPGNPGVRDYWRVDSHSTEVLKAALARAGGNQSRAAQALGLTARQFGYRVRKLGLG